MRDIVPAARNAKTGMLKGDLTKTNCPSSTLLNIQIPKRMRTISSNTIDLIWIQSCVNGLIAVGTRKTMSNNPQVIILS